MAEQGLDDDPVIWDGRRFQAPIPHVIRRELQRPSFTADEEKIFFFQQLQLAWDVLAYDYYQPGSFYEQNAGNMVTGSTNLCFSFSYTMPSHNVPLIFLNSDNGGVVIASDATGTASIGSYHGEGSNNMGSVNLDSTSNVTVCRDNNMVIVCRSGRSRSCAVDRVLGLPAQGVSSARRRFGQPFTSLVSTSASQASGFTPCNLQVSISEVSTAQFSAPRSWPANSTFLRLSAIGLIERSTVLDSISIRPSSTKRVSPSRSNSTSLAIVWPRQAKSRWGNLFLNFLPAISAKAAKAIRHTIRSWRMHGGRSYQSRNWPRASIRSCVAGSTTMASSIARSSPPSWGSSTMRCSGGRNGNSAQGKPDQSQSMAAARCSATTAPVRPLVDHFRRNG